MNRNMENAPQTIGGWRKSTYSQGQNDCVEVARGVDLVGIRDSKLGDTGPVLAVNPAAFTAFLSTFSRR